ncbi:MAG: folate-binding protein [Gammaproteobacteria bacterium]|nr:folate-binding protein [Gammaproteobacteria bacterium]
MQSDWQVNLDKYQANILDGKVVDFGQAEQELAAVSNNVICDLSHYGLISAAGADTADFLQGQFSNDVRNVSVESSQLNAYCSPKGRILASFRLFYFKDKYYLQLPTSLLEQTLKRLRMFVMRSQVTLENASEELVRMGAAGPDIAQLISDLGFACPAEVDAAKQTGNVLVIRIPGQVPRFEIHGPVAELIPVWEGLADKSTMVGSAIWSLLDIQTGLPVIQSETTESFVPQMVNLELINGVSFKKGCYPGQEIVARMQYLGKLKKRMFRAHIQSDESIYPGDALYSGSSDNKQSVGNIVNAQPSPDGGYDVLAVIQVTEADQGEVRVGNKNGSILEITKLPYSLSA